jgi:general secretion pathway protein D
VFEIRGRGTSVERVKILPLLSAVLLLCAATLPAQEATIPARAGAQEQYVGSIDIPGDNLDSILRLLEKLTGRTVLRPQNLPEATISLTLKERVTKQEAIQAIETLLNLNGIAVTPLGDRFLKATALAAAKSESPEFIEGSTLGLPPSGRIAAKVFQLQFLRVAEFMPQIAGLLNPAAGSPPVVFDKANSALVTDSVSNLQRIEQLLARLDQPALAGLAPKFYSLRFAKASDVVNKLRTILSGPLQNQIGSATSYNADDRTNQVVLVSDERQHAFFDELIAKLDVKADPNTRNEVIQLKHAAAKDVATILSQLVSGQNTASSRGGQGDTARPTPIVTAPAAPAPAAAPAGVVPGAALPAGLALDSSNQFSSLLTILPEERSNSIVVSGTVDDIRLINDLVAKLDIVLAQVRIEAVIAEVTLSDNASSGIGALGLRVEGDKVVGFSGSGAGFNVSEAVFSRDPATGNLDIAATIGLTTTPRKSHANILSQPNVVTTHNKEATIFVGESRPTISSYLNDGTGTGGGNVGTGYRSTVGQTQIGIRLKVKPLIGNDGSVQLEIEQNVDDVIGEITIDGNPQPRIGKRETKSYVTARSGDIIALGGLQRASQSRSTSRLGPVPIIGGLLGSRNREDSRTDLVFFLRPTVLTNTPADNARALEQIGKLPPKSRDSIQEAVGRKSP